MEVPLQIHFHNLEPSDAVEANVRKRAERHEHEDVYVAIRDAFDAAINGVGPDFRKKVAP